MADGMSIDWQYRPNQMAENVERYKQRLLAAVYALASEWARRILEDARQKHGWTNRTGAAERGLFQRVARIATGAVIVIAHSVSYGVHLERRFGGKYAGLIPAIQANLAAVLASLQRLVR